MHREQEPEFGDGDVNADAACAASIPLTRQASLCGQLAAPFFIMKRDPLKFSDSGFAFACQTCKRCEAWEKVAHK